MISLTEIGIIFAPLTFLPGLGMIILSTSRRYIELIRQMQQIFDRNLEYDERFFKCQRSRLGMFKWSLSLLYIAAGLIFLGSLTGSLTLTFHPLSEYLLFSFMILAVIAAVSAMFLLVKESFVSASLIYEQFEKQVEEKS
ncbi:MAG: DUF2721 domain-containing protein [Chlorobi bacterium]|nr:DUF2721 domain-containing protein [Chlorobiota bacterium]